jgi:hypothetical protein
MTIDHDRHNMQVHEQFEDRIKKAACAFNELLVPMCKTLDKDNSLIDISREEIHSHNNSNKKEDCKMDDKENWKVLEDLKQMDFNVEDDVEGDDIQGVDKDLVQVSHFENKQRNKTKTECKNFVTDNVN